MKTIIASALIALAPALAQAQTPAKPAAAKPAAEKPTAKAAAKPAAKPAARAPRKEGPLTSREELNSAANQAASGVAAAEAALSPEEIALSERVHTGRVPCELGAFVNIQADPKSPGYFFLEIVKGPKFRMFPVVSRTGAIRLEDQRTGAVWLQLANKSMLMDQRAGKRLADECMSPDQSAVAQALKVNPAPSLLDAPVPARTANAAASAAGASTAQPAVVVQPTGLPSAPGAAAVVPLTSASAPAVPATPVPAASAPR